VKSENKVQQRYKGTSPSRLIFSTPGIIAQAAVIFVIHHKYPIPPLPTSFSSNFLIMPQSQSLRLAVLATILGLTRATYTLQQDLSGNNLYVV
jgi:hypothetical protein